LVPAEGLPAFGYGSVLRPNAGAWRSPQPLPSRPRRHELAAAGSHARGRHKASGRSAIMAGWLYLGLYDKRFQLIELLWYLLVVTVNILHRGIPTEAR
jgi:hypothetical protein